MRDWTWKIPGATQDGGPDPTFRARFSPGDEERLARLVTAAELPGFSLDDIPADPGREQPGLFYYDDHTYTEMKQQYRNGTRSGIHIYNLIRVEGEKLVIMRGYGGHSGWGREVTESALLVRLALSPDVSLEHWAVRMEGHSSGHPPFAEGHSGAELLDYLHGYRLSSERGPWPRGPW